CRHGGVGLTGRPHHRGVRVVPEVEPGIDRDAVAPDRDAGLVDVAVRLGVAGLDDLVDVHARAGRKLGELVGQADVDVAVGRLGELGTLGPPGVAVCPYPC